MIGKLLCKIGFHSWGTSYYEERICKRCGRIEERILDVGSTILTANAVYEWVEKKSSVGKK